MSFLGGFIEGAPPVEGVQGQEDRQTGGQDDHADRGGLAPGRGPEGGGGGGADADHGEGAQADRQVVHLLLVGGGGLGCGVHDKLPCRCDK
ncbi:hypothetical protein D3C87_1723690 [compost metagenome]